jgi:predicted dehydrogenase
MPRTSNRRNFIKASALTGAALTLNKSLQAFSSVKKEKVRIGIIGAGFRSHEHMGNFLQRDDVEITAIADPQQRSVDEALAVFKQFKRPEPAVYKNGNEDYKNLLKRDDVDAVVICSPWEWHSTQAIDAMHAGKIAGVEVCGAVKLQEC